MKTEGHGYLADPAARNSAWRFGFPTPQDVNDNGLRCGGVTQNKFEDYRCGVCGDHYQAKTPRYVHPRYKEKYRVITKTYREGQTFTAKVKITANHRGFFEFRVGETGSGAHD